MNSPVQILIQDLASRYQKGPREQMYDGGPSVEAHELTTKTGTFYEKLRYALDYKDEHLIRHHALVRILRRYITPEVLDEKPGITFMRELVHGGYIPNHSVPESLAYDIERILRKHIILRKILTERGPKGIAVKDRVVEIAAGEISMLLFPTHEEESVVESFYNRAKLKIQFRDIGLPQEDIDVAMYLACRETLLTEDQLRLRVALWRRFIPEWSDMEMNEDNISRYIHALMVSDAAIEDGLHTRIAARLRNEGIAYSVILSILKKYREGASNVFNDTTLLEKEITAFCDKAYTREYNRVKRSGIRAVIYLLITKITLTFAVELPYERFILGALHYPALITNSIFHPVALLVMTQTIKKPDAKNTLKIIAEVKDVLAGTIRRGVVVPGSEGGALTFVLSFLYVFLFVFTLGSVISTLEALSFNPISIGLFLFFLTFVSYFGIRLRYVAARWKIADEGGGTLRLLLNLLLLPLVRAGRWLSRKFSRINIFVFILDFIIETPFKRLLGTLDAFFAFLREKEDETRFY